MTVWCKKRSHGWIRCMAWWCRIDRFFSNLSDTDVQRIRSGMRDRPQMIPVVGFFFVCLFFYFGLGYLYVKRPNANNKNKILFFRTKFYFLFFTVPTTLTIKKILLFEQTNHLLSSSLLASTGANGQGSKLESRWPQPPWRRLQYQHR